MYFLDYRSSISLPETFLFLIARCCSNVDAGTVKVVNQVLAEMAKTSGYPHPEMSGASGVNIFPCWMTFLFYLNKKKDFMAFGIL